MNVQDLITIPEAELLELLQNMIAIESINPGLTALGSGETALSEFLGEFMASAGLEVHFQEFDPGRKNVIGILRGTGKGKSLMFNGHLDTVGVQDMDIDPCDPIYDEGKGVIYGRGSMDMKGGVASMIIAAKTIKDLGLTLPGDLIIACVGDEEYESKGTEKLLESFTADAAIVTEPTGMEIMLAHKGFVWTHFKVHGRAAHGSRPEEGIDAILKASHVLTELRIWEEEELPTRSHPLLGRPSLHAATIQGGTEISVYPHFCEFGVEWRTLPGEDASSVEKQVIKILDRARKKDPSLTVNYEISFERVPLEVDKDSEIVQILGNAYRETVHVSPKFNGIAFWTDAALLADAGIPSVIFGPKGEGLHAATEYVNWNSVIQCSRILAKTAIEFCK